MKVDPFRLDKKTRERCVIYKMLREACGRHLSFHTPGHKIGAWDLTELSFSDNLSSPTGCIQTAQKEIAEILGAAASFLSTDGSTGGIFAILYAAKTLGVKRIAMPETSHKSLYNGCAALGLDAVTFAVERKNGIPAPVSLTVLSAAVDEADALFLTSPDYYGNIPDLKGIAELCKERGKLFFIDGAHGGHLHFDREKYAGAYADLWVDGVHKSLPAYTQGAIVSARTKRARPIRLWRPSNSRRGFRATKSWKSRCGNLPSSIPNFFIAAGIGQSFVSLRGGKRSISPRNWKKRGSTRNFATGTS